MQSHITSQEHEAKENPTETKPADDLQDLLKELMPTVSLPSPDYSSWIAGGMGDGIAGGMGDGYTPPINEPSLPPSSNS